MKIKKIKLINNEFYGNIEFEFMNSNSQVMDNIILAGENGCGKTQLLNIIYEFSNLSLDGEKRNEKRIFTIVLSENEIIQINNELEEYNRLNILDGELIVTYNYNIQPGYWARIGISYNSKSDGQIIEKEIDASLLFSRSNINSIFKSIFSTVEINYNPQDTSIVTAKEIDENVQQSIRSGNDLASEIQQLFIDIHDNDAHEVLNWVNEHKNQVVPEDVANRRIKRFKSAFSRVFDDLNFSKIVTENDKKKVYFEKRNKNIEIAALSSGEKQIVFRGAFLLRNQQSTKGAIILIDEPEISLHPNWQLKIFDYYRRLFLDENEKQTSQIFFATHSQYVLQSALEEYANTSIMLFNREKTGVKVKTITAPVVLPTITSAELNYIAFDITSNDYHIQLYGYLQNKIAASSGNSSCSVKQCDEYIKQSKEYNQTQHERKSSYKTTKYDTLPTYVRNAIDHPDNSRKITPSELRTSIELLIKLCR